MKATGIVRRIDDLGRVVIPKEIRRTMRLREGEPLEIFTDSAGGVVFKKYSPAGEQSSTATNLCESIYRTCARPVVICDRDSIIASAGSSRRASISSKYATSLTKYFPSRQASPSKQSKRIPSAIIS